MRKDFLQVVSRPLNLLRALRQIAFGSLVAGAGLATANTHASAAETAPPTRPALTATIVDRSKKAAKLVLQLPNSATGWVAQHRSHRSHSSHRSHYSSTGGGTAPPPARPATPPAPRAAAPRSSTIEVNANTIAGEIESIDKVKRTFVLKLGTAVTATMTYLDDTKYETSLGGSMRFDEFAKTANGQLPISVRQKVQVTWKMSPDGKTVLATSILWKPNTP